MNNMEWFQKLKIKFAGKKKKKKSLKLDPLEVDSLAVEVLGQLPFLSQMIMFRPGEIYMALYNADEVYKQESDRYLDALSSLRYRLKMRTTMETPYHNTTLPLFDLNWALVYVVSCYVCRNDDAWKRIVLPAMLQVEIDPRILDEMHKGEELVRQYIARRQVSEDKQSEESPKAVVESLSIFTKKAIREGKVDEIKESLKNSMPSSRRDKARALVEEIRYWQAEGYVDKNYDASVYYDDINKITPLPFSYDGFRKYYYE